MTVKSLQAASRETARDIGGYVDLPACVDYPPSRAEGFCREETGAACKEPVPRLLEEPKVKLEDFGPPRMASLPAKRTK